MMSGSQHRTMEQLGGTQAQEVNSLKIFFFLIYVTMLLFWLNSKLNSHAFLGKIGTTPLQNSLSN